MNSKTTSCVEGVASDSRYNAANSLFLTISNVNNTYVNVTNKSAYRNKYVEYIFLHMHKNQFRL